MSVLELNRTASADGSFTGSGGRRIFWRAWLPEGPARAVVALAHGVSEHSGRYGHVGGALADAGFAVYALDHQGHGRSEGSRAVVERISGAVADLDQLIDLAAAEQPGLPVFLLGHSMGGAISLEHALVHQDRLQGLILSGPAAASESAPAPLRALARLLSALTPSLPLLAIDADAVSSDPEVVRDYENDPLNHHGKIPARTVAELAASIEAFPERLSALTLPMLVLHGSEDELVPPAASEMIAERAGSADLRLVIYPGLAHEILNEPDWEPVLAEIRGWVEERLSLQV